MSKFGSSHYSVKSERLLLPSDSDESCAASPDYCTRSDVLLSGAGVGGDSPSAWGDPGTDDSLGGGEMAPLNLAGPQDLTTALGKQVRGARWRINGVIRIKKENVLINVWNVLRSLGMYQIIKVLHELVICLTG